MRDLQRRNTLRLFLLAAGLACACTAGPNYKRPLVATPDQYRGLPADQAGQADSGSFGDQKWWDAFQDETLQALIRTALEQNYDVRIAAVRILEARAQLGITRADQLPTVSAGAAIANERIPRSVSSPAFDTSVSQLTVAAAWELDFWGKFRRATEAARANLLANEWARHEVISTVVSEVASWTSSWKSRVRRSSRAAIRCA
jgi:multidrug efflux system outer membrane protein